MADHLTCRLLTSWGRGDKGGWGTITLLASAKPDGFADASSGDHKKPDHERTVQERRVDSD